MSTPIFYPAQPGYNYSNYGYSNPNGPVFTQQPYPQQQPTIIYQQQPQQRQQSSCCSELCGCCQCCLMCCACAYLTSCLSEMCCMACDN